MRLPPGTQPPFFPGGQNPNNLGGPTLVGGGNSGYLGGPDHPYPGGGPGYLGGGDPRIVSPIAQGGPAPVGQPNYADMLNRSAQGNPAPYRIPSPGIDPGYPGSAIGGGFKPQAIMQTQPAPRHQGRHGGANSYMQQLLGHLRR